MRKLIIICAALLLASPAWGIVYLGNSDWTQPYTDDQYTAALWHFDEATGTDTPIVDSSTWDDTGHDLGIVKGLNYELDPNKLWVSSMTGFDTCVKTYWNSASDSNYGALSAPDNPSTLYTSQGGDWTYEFWMHPFAGGSGSGVRILKKYTGGCFAVTLNASNQVSLSWYKGGWRSAADTSSAITLNAWQHVMITVDQTSDTDTSLITFYRNGVKTNEYLTPEGQNYSNWDNGSIKLLNDDSGTLYGYRQYQGMLDEVRISNCIRIPEPTTLSLLAIGALAFLRRRKK